jgi:O-antigen/teichoic acid export membrane protein
MGLKGILLSTLIQTSLSTIVLLFFVFRRIGFTFERSLLPDMLKFGLPLVPAAILMFIMNNGDRYFLNLFTSRDQVGIYGLGYRLGVVTTNLVLFPFGKVWSVVMVSISENEDGAHRLGRISTYLMAALTFSNLGMSLMSPYVVSTLAADQYHDAYKVVALIGASYLLYAWTTVMDASFYITKRTGYKPLILLISGVVIFALYSWLIPKYGMMGAAWATLGGFIAFTCVTLFSAQRIYRIHYEWVRMAKLMTLAVLLYLAGSSIPPENLGSSLALRVAAILVFIAVVCSDFIAQPWEREFVMSYLKTTWTRFMARNKEAEAKAEA